jgi:hypothetical protein
MKLYGSDSSELMEVRALRPDGNRLIVEGTIMGAMPIQAVLTPAQLRSAFKLLSFKTFIFVVGMLLRK